MKTKTINQTGIIIEGTSIINMWGGGQGEINMNPSFLPNDKISKDNILRCVNDGSFGCESIDSAMIDILIKYDNGCTEYDRTIEASGKHQRELFLGWRELRQQGIEI